MGDHQHIMDPVTFHSDTESVTVYATAGTYRNATRLDIDFGLYADRIWYPPLGRNEFIHWVDMRTPEFPEIARHQIIDAFIRACAGERVEIGCIGAHGRTGTILACMASLAGMPNPVAYVRENYCPRAVETSQQEVYVEWFEHRCFG